MTPDRMLESDRNLGPLKQTPWAESRRCGMRAMKQLHIVIFAFFAAVVVAPVLAQEFRPRGPEMGKGRTWGGALLAR